MSNLLLVIMTALAIIPYSLLTQGFYTSIVHMISTVTMGTCSIIKSIYVHKNPDVDSVIKKMDIEMKIELIQLTINKISQIKGNKNIDDIKTDPICMCLFHIHDVIKEINQDLTNINDKVIRHKNKWFCNWRSLNVTPMIDSLKFHSIILDARFDDLIKISSLLRNADI